MAVSKRHVEEYERSDSRKREQQPRCFAKKVPAILPELKKLYLPVCTFYQAGQAGIARKAQRGKNQRCCKFCM